MFLMKKIKLIFALVLFFQILAKAQVPLSNLLYWFKCDSFVVKDNFNNVLGWKNAIDTNQILTNTNLTNSPTFTNNTLHFDGIDDYLSINFTPIAQPISYVVLWKGGNSSSAQLVIDGVDANRNALIYYSSPPNPSIGFFAGLNFFDYPKSTFNNPIISTLVFDNASSTIYQNGIARITNQNPGSTGVNGLTIGSKFDFVFPLNGDISEILVYDKVLGIAEINSINDYLINKYSEPVNLGNDIIVTNSFCDTTLASTGNFESYLWSNGLTTPTIQVNQSGTYWLSAVDGFGKTYSDTILVAYPAINLPTKNTFCSNDTLIWDTELPKSYFTFLWQNNSTDSLQKIYQPGTYSLSVSDGFGCSITSNLISVAEDSYPITTTLGNDTTMCAGNFISLTYGANQTTSYLWNNSSTTSSIAINASGQYSAIFTNTNNCIAKDTIDVVISGQAPTANFSNNIGCINSLVSFSNLSSPPIGNTIDSTIWNFGDLSATNTSTLVNPSHTFTSTGSYFVSLKVITDSGCEQSIVKTIVIAPIPSASFAIGASCQNDSTAFINLSTGSVGYPLTSYNWNFGDSNTSSTTSPKHVFTNVINYSITLVVTNSVGCTSSVTKTLTPQSEVKANFTNGPVCLNNPTLFQSTSIIPPSGTTTYSWIFPGSTATVANPIKTFTNSGVYNVTLIIDGNNGCTSSITKLVNVYLPPIASFSIPSFCAKDTVNVINLSNPQSGIISSYNWRLNNITFSTVQSPTLSITNPGNNSVRLTTINSFGCKDSTTNSLTIFPLPVVDFSTTPVAFYYINEPINYTPSITNASSYLWNMNGNSTYTIQSPTETFSIEGSYNVNLNLKDQNGCKGAKTKNITVSKRHLDLAILNVSTTKDNDGFMTVITDVANYGSVPISSFKMGYQISDGGNIKETWNGTLNPNSFYTFTFNAVSASTQNSENNITCVEIEKVNTIIDDNTTNNSFCSSLNTDDIYVSNPLPNPTDGDIVLPITLNRGFDYTIAIYNSVGQIQYEETTKKGIEGLNFLPLNTSSYARGAYIIKVMIDEKIFIKKFIKTSFE